MDLKKIRILSTVSSPLRERCSGHLMAWRASYPVNEEIRLAASIDETAIHINKMASCSVDTASVTPHMLEIAKSILHISLMSCIIYSSDMGL